MKLNKVLILLSALFVSMLHFESSAHAREEKAKSTAVIAPPMDRSAVEAIVRSYLLDNPELIPEVLARHEAREREARITNALPQLVKPFEGAWIGNPNGDVVVVEFFDYACGFCRRSLPDIEKLVAEDPGVKVVFREFPILGQSSLDAARLSLTAAQLGRYSEIHKLLFALEKLDNRSIRKVAQNAGIALPSDFTTVDAEFRSNHKLAQQLQISGTPAFLVGNRLLSGAVGYEELKKQVSLVRSEMGKDSK